MAHSGGLRRRGACLSRGFGAAEHRDRAGVENPLLETRQVPWAATSRRGRGTVIAVEPVLGFGRALEQPIEPSGHPAAAAGTTSSEHRDALSWRVSPEAE